MVYTSISGVAAIENARIYNPDKPKSVTLDAQFFLGNGKTVLAALQYYNGDNIEFSADDYQVFHVQAQVVRATEHATFNPSHDLERDDYHLVGEITALLPLPYDTDISRRPALISILGVCSAVDKAANTFDIDSNPYTSIHGSSGWLSVRATFASARFTAMNQKPFPSVSNGVMVEGFANGAVWTDAGKIERLCINIERVVFPNKAKGSLTPKSAIPPETPPSKGLKFSLGKRPAVSPASSSLSDELSSSLTPTGNSERPLKQVKIEPGVGGMSKSSGSNARK